MCERLHTYMDKTLLPSPHINKIKQTPLPFPEMLAQWELQEAVSNKSHLFHSDQRTFQRKPQPAAGYTDGEDEGDYIFVEEP